MGKPTDELRARLDERGVEYEAFRDVKNRCITEWRTYHGAFVFFAVENEGKLFVETASDTSHSAICTPEQAIAATVGDKPKDNPRNYNPDGTPKIPNMHIGADPDWVDWVARLKHEEPLSLKEAVEQLMFEIICFGGDMGPNDCGGEHCPDEGMVYTNDFINGWVNKIAATVGKDIEHYDGSGRRGAVAILQGGRKPEEVFFISDEGGVTHYLPEGAGTCKDVCASVSEFTCSECGFNCDLTSWISLFDGDDGRHRHHHHGTPNFCPNCGKRIKED